MGDVTKTAVYIDVPGNQNALSGHNMSTWQFTDDGQIKDANGNPVIHAGKRSLAMISASFAILSDFKNNVLAKDSLTNTEKVFLDSEQAAIITKNLATGAAGLAEELETEKNEAEQQLTDIWNDVTGNSDLITFLSYDEMLSEYAVAGVTQESIVTAPVAELAEKVIASQEIASAFAMLDEQTQVAIGTLVETDTELAEVIQSWTERLNS